MCHAVMLSYNVYLYFKFRLLSFMFINYFVYLICRLGCLVLLVTAVVQSSSSVLDLTQFGDVEKNPGPHTGL